MLTTEPTHPINESMRREAISRRIGCPDKAWMLTFNGNPREACIVDLEKMIRQYWLGKEKDLDPNVVCEAVGPKVTHRGTPADFLVLLK